MITLSEPPEPDDSGDDREIPAIGFRSLLPAVPLGDGDGLRLSFELDLDAVFAALGRERPDWTDVDQEQDLADAMAARDREDAPPPVDLSAAIAQALPAGPGLAAWLDSQDPAGATSHDLPGLAAAYRRLASWAQARELAMVAQIAARSAAADPKAGLGPDGQPAFVTQDAAAQVSLELVLSHFGAEAWTDLAVTLQWRLPGTAAALAEGRIDLIRARILAEATTSLTGDAARQVEDAVLPRAPELTYAQLHAAVRRAVIAADPEGAEHRRQSAERRAKVSLYPDQDCTASLAGTRLPAAHATAAMARISAMARALKASGACGGIDLLRAQVFLGLLLGTLPLIPPPADGPPDADPADPSPPDASPPDASPTRTGPGGSGPPDTRPPGTRPPGSGPPDTRPPGTRPPGSGPPDASPPVDESGGGSADRDPENGDPEGGHRGAGVPGDGTSRGTRRHRHSPGSGAPGRRDEVTRDEVTRNEISRNEISPPDTGPAAEASPAGTPDGVVVDPWPAFLPLTDADMPEDDGSRDAALPLPPGYVDWDPDRGDPIDDHFSAAGVVPAWPPVPVAVPTTPGAAEPCGTSGPAAGGRPPPGGLLDLTLPFSTLSQAGDMPGVLGRIGPITAQQARQLAGLGSATEMTEWRVILTDASRRAIAVARLPRLPRLPQLPRLRPPPPAAVPLAPVVGRVTVVLPAADLDKLAQDAGDLGRSPVPDLPLGADLDRVAAGLGMPWTARDTGSPQIRARVLAAAERARDAAGERAAADRLAPGGCAHTTSSAAYTPPARIREEVIARDQTCRSPRCGQPAWRADLDHTRPFDRGGRTCQCNLGAMCRHDHRLKQMPGWSLSQPQPGTFRWTTSAGRSYTVQPDQHPA